MSESKQIMQAQKIANEHLNLKIQNIEPIGKGYNNFIYKLSLQDCRDHQFRSQPGTVPFPPETQFLILRLPNPDAALNNASRVEHEVAMLSLLRSSKSELLRSLIPNVYSWANVNSANHGGWILSEYMLGSNIGLEFPRLPLERQKIILPQLAQIIKAIQEIRLPDTVNKYGGVCFNDNGVVISGAPALPGGGPFETYQDLYRSLLRQQLDLSDKSDVLMGWKYSSIRDRLEKFLANGIDPVLKTAAIPDHNIVTHGDLSTHNILVDPETLRITALLDFEFSQLASPLEEYLHSFYDTHGIIPGPFTTDDGLLVLRRSLLEGFSDPLPESPPLPTGPVKFGTKKNIQWPLAKAWDDELAKAGVMRPATIPYAAEISSVYWLSQEICPFYFLQKMWIESRGEEQVKEEKIKQEELLDQYLKKFGY